MSDQFVLVDSLETQKRGTPVFLHCITVIGPAYTEALNDAERFSSKEKAMQSPAFFNPLCFFSPKPAKSYEELTQ
jgi:hypothetical protein